MFVWKSTYERHVAESREHLEKLGILHQNHMDAVAEHIVGIEADCTYLRETNYALDRTAAKYKAERDADRDDLSMMTDHATRLQAEIDRMRAPLIAANRRRAEDAKARREAVAPVLKAVG